MTFLKDQSPVNRDSAAESQNKLSTDAIADAGKHDSAQDLGEESRRSLSVQDSGDRNPGQLEPLFDDKVDHEFRGKWQQIQTGFVDEPRSAVERADELVAELMQRLAQSFSQQRNNLEHQWDASDKVSTEELRVALTKYRSFFERLLSI